jgi:hypothetical protein
MRRPIPKDIRTFQRNLRLSFSLPALWRDTGPMLATPAHMDKLACNVSRRSAGVRLVQAAITAKGEQPATDADSFLLDLLAYEFADVFV